MRAITYLAPGIPIGSYKVVVDRVAKELGEPIELMSDAPGSRPQHDEPNPLVEG